MSFLSSVYKESWAWDNRKAREPFGALQVCSSGGGRVWVDGCHQGDDLVTPTGETAVGVSISWFWWQQNHFYFFEKVCWMPSALVFPLQNRVRGWAPMADSWARIKWPNWSMTTARVLIGIFSSDVDGASFFFFFFFFYFKIFRLCCLPEPNANFQTPEFAQTESFNKALVGCLSVRLHSEKNAEFLPGNIQHPGSNLLS